MEAGRAVSSQAGGPGRNYSARLGRIPGPGAFGRGPVADPARSLPVAAGRVWVAECLLSAADRGLNYSPQQATKETLYAPLTDPQNYKGKAVIERLAWTLLLTSPAAHHAAAPF